MNSIYEYCSSCYNLCDPWTVKKFKILYEGSKIHEQDELFLCYICARLARHTEQLVNNIKSKPKIYRSSDPKSKSIISLSLVNLQPVEISTPNHLCDEQTSIFTVTSIVNGLEETKCCDAKYKEEKSSQDGVEVIVPEIDHYDNPVIKQEYITDDDNTLKDLLNDGLIERVRKKVKKKRHKNKPTVKKETEVWAESKVEIPIIHLTLQEFLQENVDKAKNIKYLNAQFKCEDCVLGFSYKISYLKHMEMHSNSSGDLICDLCNRRIGSKALMQRHLARHTTRYKCMHCGLLRNSRKTIREHLYSVHMIGNTKSQCLICNKVFKLSASLKRHIKIRHSVRERVPCLYCNKTYKSVESRKAHMILLHSSQVAPIKREKSHLCTKCNASFRTAAFLRSHLLSHSDAREFYCVECDKSYKSDGALKKHLQTSIHAPFAELPLACEHCDKRFLIKRNLERHINRIHLNIRPFQCEICPKAYLSSWSLNEHKKLKHEGYKRPLLFQCEFCDKAFGRKQILKAHIRTHTGERPYQCNKCQASFCQAGVLNTHNKLVHLRLTRDGKKK